MILTRPYHLVVRFANITNKYLLYRCSSSTDRCETISAALKQFYLKVHPDLFSQYPKEKDVNEKSLQLVSAYLSGLQRKEYMASISVTFFTKSSSKSSPPAQISLISHRITLNSNDLLASVNSILTALNLPIVNRPKEQKQVDRHEIQFNIIEIEKFYDFTKIPKISIKTWLTNNVEAARIIAKRHQELLNDINDKVNSIKERFKLKSIEYSDEWSVPQFSTCLRTLIMYADKWHNKLLTLQGKRLIFGDKSCLLQDGSLELSANDPPIYWDHVICCELLESNKYMEKIASYENNLSQYFHGIKIGQDPDSEYLCRAHTYLYHLIQLSAHLNLNCHHEAHRKISWTNFYLFINPYSSEASLTNSGFFQINAFDATMDILDFMIANRKQAEETRILYEKDVEKERNLLEIIKEQFNLTDILINRRLKKSDINQCCQRLLNERQHFLNILTKCRLKIDKNYNLAQNGTISIPWDWSFSPNETLSIYMLRFLGRVVVVTGAGNGLGKEYALAFGERGASVVVNDLGGNPSGDGSHSARPADEVVKLIQSRGGKAVADYHSVEDGKAVIDTAIKNFGRIDILVNNAGILRDKSFMNMTEQDWDLVHRIHLRAAYLLTYAAWSYMRQQKYGRVIFTTSTSGLYGNFGQANYSAAKMGLVGLSNTLALEGAKYNITCHTIAPTAYSRLTQDLLPPDAEENLKPAFVMPLVLYLCHESCTDTGSLFEVAGGWIGKVRLEKSSGAMVRRPNTPMTVEDVRDNWKDIISFATPLHHLTQTEQVTHLLDTIRKLNNNDDDKVITQTFSYTANQIILYALSVGCSLRQPNSLRFLYENHEEFSALPTFAVIPAQSLSMNLISSGKLGIDIDLLRALHGEQYVELFEPLPTSGTVILKGKLVDVLDKGSGAIIIFDVEMYNEKEKLIALNQFVIFSVGSGGFGGKKTSENQRKSLPAPQRKSDQICRETTNIDQAALYRLNGDSNPLHIDPSFASAAGFPRPILHGLCSFGYAARHVLHTYANNNPALFKAIKVRFSKPVEPGQTIETHMWREGNRIFFESKVPESNQTILTGGYVDLHDVVLNTNTPGTAQESSTSSSEVELKAKTAFDEINKRAKSQPDLVKKVGAIIVFDITKDGNFQRSWTIDGKKGTIYEGKPLEGTTAQVTITVDDNDFVDLASGKANAPALFAKGKLKVKGNVMLAQKLSTLFKDQAKL
ncbi:unnamed protein product [Rotaria sp. Silwood2]|nr:unnamed protein product [Rotaria sp. Silwood2]